MKSPLLLSTVVSLAAASYVSANCYINAGSATCCASLGVDVSGPCTPWAHSCSYVVISNPAIFLTTTAVSGKASASATPFACTYQPRTCQFIGCSAYQAVASSSCISSQPTGSSCPGGGGGGGEEEMDPPIDP